MVCDCNYGQLSQVNEHSFPFIRMSLHFSWCIPIMPWSCVVSCHATNSWLGTILIPRFISICLYEEHKLQKAQNAPYHMSQNPSLNTPIPKTPIQDPQLPKILTPNHNKWEKMLNETKANKPGKKLFRGWQLWLIILPPVCAQSMVFSDNFYW